MSLMRTRAEPWFRDIPRFGALLYDVLAGRPRTIGLQFKQIAGDLTSRSRSGRLLDVGTGPGRLLRAVYELAPEVKLFGLDISEAMIRVARRNLAGLDVDLRVGNIRSTDYEDGFFDLVTSSGSFYLWEEPLEGLSEIHRILSPGGVAVLFEPRARPRDRTLRRDIRQALRRENPLRRLVGPFFIRQVVRLGLRGEELASLLERSPFAGSCRVDHVTLGDLPVWLRIELVKEAP